MRCVAQARDKAGHLGTPLRSNIVTIGTEGSICHTPVTTGTARGFQAQSFIASLKYLDVKHKEHPNRSGETFFVSKWLNTDVEVLTQVLKTFFNWNCSCNSTRWFLPLGKARSKWIYTFEGTAKNTTVRQLQIQKNTFCSLSSVIQRRKRHFIKRVILFFSEQDPYLSADPSSGWNASTGVHHASA